MKRAYEDPQIQIKKTELYESVAETGNCWSKMANTSGVYVTYTDAAPPYTFSATYQFTPTTENCMQANTITPDSIQNIMIDLKNKYTTYNNTHGGTEYTEFMAAYNDIEAQLIATNKTSTQTENFTFYFGSGSAPA